MSHQYKAHTPDGLYFMTCTMVDWIDLFTRAAYKLEIIRSLKYCQQHKGLQLYAWCLMPSHLHLIAAAAEGLKLGPIMRDFKKFTAQNILKLINEENESRRDWMLQRFYYTGKFLSKITHYKFWQDGYHAIKLTSNDLMQQKLDYLHRNPVTDLTVAEPEHYVFSSASNYAGNGGLLDVIFLE